ncbi:MAG: cysteine--tRNA ligase [Thermomicrobiales bacterium]|nr:cysteine--tRNA ligase [Thermomicrobiales bacterium]
MRLYNTQSGAIEPVRIDGDPLGMYVCGVTPYDTTHAGHAFNFLTFDIIARFVRYLGGEITYVQNVTDIDDDILRKSAELGMTWLELGDRETAKFRNDMRNLNALDPDHYVRATEHTVEMIELITSLLEKKLAYESQGSVYFDVNADPDFGKLSKIPRGEMLAVANERGNYPDDPKKRHPLDFVLWQAAAPGEPTWPSPWSDGRPGWHIECSAMAIRYLGPSIDIHGGGSDLIFPHHECEIAQSENATGVTPFSRHWVHVGMVGYEGEKMSKSLGNLILISDLLETYSSDTFRLYAFSHHYREPWEYIDGEIDEWVTTAEDIANAVALPGDGMGDHLDAVPSRERFVNALSDDLNTGEAIKALTELTTDILQAADDDDISDAQNTLRQLGEVLGLTMER